MYVLSPINGLWAFKDQLFYKYFVPTGLFPTDFLGLVLPLATFCRAFDASLL
jgi:hypothetical protein